MATTKSSNTFAPYQEAKQIRRQQYIEAYLLVARMSRQKYDYVTDLARAVSHHISVIEKREGVSEKECKPSTLLRNIRYKALLLSYQAESASPGLRNTNKRAVKFDPTEPSNALLVQLETSNLRLENQRLKYHIADLEKALTDKGVATIAASGAASVSDAEAELSDMEFNYVSTCQVVMAILSKLQDVLTVDVEKKRILNAAVRRGDNVIAGGRLAEPFFDWLNKHAAGM